MGGSILEISVRTPEREILVDITERVQSAVAQARPGFNGLVSVFVPHTTAGVTINEGADPTVIRDIIDHLRRLVPRESGFHHSEGNSDAHIKASLIGSSAMVPVEGGQVAAGHVAERLPGRVRRTAEQTGVGDTGDRRPRRSALMSDDSRANAADSACGPGGLADLCERVLSDFIADPARNNLGPGAPDPAWEGYLLGFAAGNDPLWEELKTAAGPEHWTPAEAFAAARDASTPAAGSPNSKQPTTPWAAGPAAAASPAAPEDLTVISWAVVQTEATKASNRLETRMPSEPWARARVFGQMANRELHHVLLDAVRAEGYEAIAPAMLAVVG